MKKASAANRGGCFRASDLTNCSAEQLVRATANRRVVEAHVAAAAALAAAAQAVAAGLNHCLAGLVARCAANAAAIFRKLALANTASEIALAAANSVAGATAAAQAIRQHPAKVLQRSAGHIVIAAAMNLAAVRGLFELDRAARQYTPVRRLLRLSDLARLNARNRTREWRDCR